MFFLPSNPQFCLSQTVNGYGIFPLKAVW